MKKDKPFSIIEIFLGVLILLPIDVVELLLDLVALGFLLTPIEWAVDILFSLWFAIKGRSSMAKRQIAWWAGSIVEFAPGLSLLPIRTVMFVVNATLMNKEAEKEGVSEKRGGIVAGGDDDETSNQDGSVSEEEAPGQNDGTIDEETRRDNQEIIEAETKAARGLRGWTDSLHQLEDEQHQGQTTSPQEVAQDDISSALRYGGDINTALKIKNDFLLPDEPFQGAAKEAVLYSLRNGEIDRAIKIVDGFHLSPSIVSSREIRNAAQERVELSTYNKDFEGALRIRRTFGLPDEPSAEKFQKKGKSRT